MLKLDTAGNFVWVDQLGGRQGMNALAEAHAVTSDAAGNIYVGGVFSGTGDFDPGPGTYDLTVPNGDSNSAFVVKLTPAGGLVWADARGDVFLVGGCSTGQDLDPTSGTYAAPGSDTYLVKLTPKH